MERRLPPVSAIPIDLAALHATVGAGARTCPAAISSIAEAMSARRSATSSSKVCIEKQRTARLRPRRLRSTLNTSSAGGPATTL